MERRSDSCMCDRWTGGERKEESGGDEADQRRSPHLKILQHFLPFLSPTPPSHLSISDKQQMLNAQQHKMPECCFNGTSTPPSPLHSLFYLTLVITTSLPLFISSSPPPPTLPPLVTHPRPPAPSPGNRAPNGNLAPGHIL